MQHLNRWIVVILIIATLPLAACSQKPPSASAPKPAVIEPIEGSDFKRVVLTEKATQRLDIQTASLREEQVMRNRIVEGEVVSLPEAEATDLNDVYVHVRLNENDLNKVDRSQSALITPLTGGDRTAGLSARTFVRLAVGDAEEEQTALYYEIESADHGLVLGQIVQVELPLLGSGAQQKIVPYAAVIYGLKGETWVYTNPEPLVFVRQSVSVDYIEGDLAILSKGPSAGTAVVTVGGAELYGAETGVSK